MGIQIQTSLFENSPEERERLRRQSFRKRVITLVSTLSIALLARFIIKDPPPPKAPDRSHDQVRYVPGMLDALPASERVKLDPKILAKMMEADENARKGVQPQDSTLVHSGTYHAAEPAFENEEIAQDYKQNLAYNIQKRKRIQEHTLEQVDDSKKYVVQFRSGGYVRAENALASNSQVAIRITRNLRAQVPATMVANINTNALTWKEPIPIGFVQLKPAKGIAITVRKDIADRISHEQEPTDEI